MYTLVFFVPDSHLVDVKNAVFHAGGGHVGPYEQSCWEVKGQGQFLPQPGANPHTGQIGLLEKLSEYRVEVMVSESTLEACVAALKLAHPYECPVFYVIKIEVTTP